LQRISSKETRSGALDPQASNSLSFEGGDEMKLSEAIALGRTLVCRLTEGGSTTLGALPGDGCVLDMAALAVGNRSWVHCKEEWPWLKEFSPGYGGDYESDIYTRFDFYVMRQKSMTLDQLIDWVRSVEPAEVPAAPLEQPLEHLSAEAVPATAPSSLGVLS
jgi:hypothetical protein